LVARSNGFLLPARSLSISVFWFALSLSSACRSERSVAVRVSIPDLDSRETPAAGVGIIALPYDRDSVIVSLEARARTPRPDTAALDSLFARFREPFSTYTRLSYAAASLRDSLRAIERALQAQASSGSGHRVLSTRIRQLSDSLALIERRTERARRELDRARIDFVSRSESLRAAVRHWEDSTYRGYDSIVERLTNQAGRQAVTDTTDATGWAEVTLTPGPWWIYARAWDTGDPNAEWYWNIPVEGDTVLLSSRTGRRRPKY
jgi:hypothetical protein